MARTFVSASSQYLTNSSYTLLDGLQKCSVSAWMKRTTGTSAARVGAVTVTAVTGWQMVPYSDGRIYFQVFNGTASYGLIIEGNIATMRHIGMRFDGSQATANDRVLGYVSGAPVVLTYVGTLPTTMPTVGVMEVGRAGGTVSDYTDCTVAEVACWDTDLTAAEFAMLGLGYSPLLIRPQSLLSYWPLIGRESPEGDRVGRAGLTLINAPSTTEHPRVLYPGAIRNGVGQGTGGVLSTGQSMYPLARRRRKR